MNIHWLRELLRQGDDELPRLDSLAPGTIVTDCKTYFKIASSDGYVNVLSLQLAGKKRMEINDFLRGYRHTEKAYVK